MINEHEAKEKVGEGWIKAWMAFEAISTEPETVKQSLSSLLENVEKDTRLSVFKKGDLKEPQKIDNPFKKLTDLKHVWASSTEVHFVIKNFEDMVNISLEYGPSAIEILEPKSIKLDIRSAQSILNTTSSIMHRITEQLLGEKQ